MKRILLLLLLSSSIFGAETADFMFSPDYAGFSLRMATNYQVFKNPWEVPLDVPSFDLNTSLPIGIQEWKPNLSGVLPEDYFGLNSSLNSSFSLGLKTATSISASFPFMLGSLERKYGFRGAVSAFKTKNLDFGISADVTNMGMTTTSLGGSAEAEENLQVKLKALINAPLFYNMEWETFSVGYTFSPNKDLMLSAAMQRHTFVIETDNYMNLDMFGSLTYYPEGKTDYVKGVSASPLRAELQYNMPDIEGDEVYMDASGKFQGNKWIPVLGLKASKLSIVFRPGATVTMKGDYQMGLSLPSFFNMDSLFENGLTDENSIEIDQDNPAEALPLITSSSTTSREYYTSDNCYGTIPTSFTFGYTFFKDHFNVSWTHFSDAFVLNHENKANSFYYIDGELAPDSLQYKGKQNFYLYVKISNIFLLSGEYSYFDYTLGYMDMSVRVVEDESLQDNIPLPILGLGARTKTKYELYTKIYISPIPSIVGGLRFNL